MRTHFCQVFFSSILLAGCVFGRAQQDAKPSGEVRLRLVSSLPGKPHFVPEVAWLTPLAGTPAMPFPQHGNYILLQQNRMFSPHLLVIPKGSSVQFPNADPFFHNVFSLFDGKRFDLGLYEAGSSKSVVFSKEGYSYIFCNIHPEMSAVILALSSPLYAIGGADHSFAIQNVSAGDYELHIWIEGVPDATLSHLIERVHVEAALTDLGTLRAPIPEIRPATHTDLFGKSYEEATHPIY